MLDKKDQGRRNFLLKAGGFSLAALGGMGILPLLPSDAEASAPPVPLRLTNDHTLESYNIELFQTGRWNPKALLVCDWLMRDHRENVAVQCDRRLYAALYVMQRYFAPQARIELKSGFRTIKTNEMLRNTSALVAKDSFHTKARAVDFVIEGGDLQAMARAAWNLNLGGIGLYDNFLHIDTGPRRTWGYSF